MIKVNNQYYLDAFLLSDELRLAETINDAEIARNTLTIPYPYTLSDAQWWLQQSELHRNCDKPQRHWAIRNKHGLVCGSIGLHFKYGADADKDELGYWLMQPLWGKGIMTDVLKTFTSFCSETRALKRLEAPIFEFNKASGRVLQKSGFVLEKRIKNAHIKDNKPVNSLLYTKTYR